MYYIRRKSDNLIQYRFTTEPMFTSHLVKPIEALDIKPETHEMIQIGEPPSVWYGGLWAYDGIWAIADASLYDIAIKQATTFDVLSTDTWSIPADATTFATVTYTDDETVYFSVNETIHAVEPVDYIATLEITADAPGPIRVEVKAQQLIIAALEVV